MVRTSFAKVAASSSPCFGVISGRVEGKGFSARAKARARARARVRARVRARATALVRVRERVWASVALQHEAKQ